MCFRRHWYHVLFSITFTSAVSSIANTNFNSNIREYSVNDHEGISNTTNIKTLQKDIGRHATFAPANTPLNYKEVPDSALSSSSHSRGLVHHEHPGYVISDYEDIPHYGHGYEYHAPEPHDYKFYDHYNTGHQYAGHYDHGPHHKHYDHALAAKTLLWPIAGIALLGAAAALVSNPVLLQLGVVSGRRRRDTEQVSHEEYIPDFEKQPDVVRIRDSSKSDQENLKKRLAQWNAFKEVKHRVPKAHIKLVDSHDYPKSYKINDFDDRFIPIPIKIKDN